MKAFTVTSASITICWAVVLGVSDASAQSAERHYRTYCASCHQDFAVSGTERTWRHGATDEDLARIIRDGLPAVGMPAFGRTIPDGEIAALVSFIRGRDAGESTRNPSMLGTTLDADALDVSQSAGYAVMHSETDTGVRYVGNFDFGSSLCYRDIDLTGVQSIDFDYARGIDDPGRFAILIGDPDGLGPRTNIGEKGTSSSGGWETFRRLRVGLSQAVTGRHSLCFFGIDGGGIFNLRSFTLSAEQGSNDGVTRTFEPPPAVLSGGGHEFSLERVAEAPAELWSMTFLPDGSIAATQKNGELLLYRNGEKLGPVAGLPAVWNRGQGGLLDAAAHPDFARNRWLYLTYSDSNRDGAMTRVVRGQLNGLEWTNPQTIYRADDEFYTPANVHFGSRLAFADGHVYFTIGDRGQRELAQDLRHPQGKIHRLRDDGSVPKDNPFAARKDVLASIWSYGHRNPQGLTIDPATRAVWSTEHGPMGGDELNLVQGGLNYGWPLATFGTDYDGTTISEDPRKQGTQPPSHHWTPSIGVSGIALYQGDRFPAWRNRLLVASLGRQELRLLTLRNREVVSDVLLLQGVGRIRDVRNGPDGYPYVVLNHPNGQILRLVPAERAQGAGS